MAPSTPCRASTMPASVRYAPVAPTTTRLTCAALDRNHAMPGAGNEMASDLLAEFERKKRAANLIVPTADRDVKLRLRSLKEPITLFGEGPADRRDRLRKLLADAAEAGGEDAEDVVMEEPDAPADEQEEFYTQGTQALLDARRDMATFSLPRAKQRIAYQRQEATIPLKAHVEHRNKIKDTLKGFELYGSQTADRPVSVVRVSPNGQYVAYGTWGARSPCSRFRVWSRRRPTAEGTPSAPRA